MGQLVFHKANLYPEAGKGGIEVYHSMYPDVSLSSGNSEFHYLQVLLWMFANKSFKYSRLFRKNTFSVLSFEVNLSIFIN